MPNHTTPPKHKTPNYKLVTHTHEATTWTGSKRKYLTSRWEPVALRTDRKDLSNT